MSVAQITSGNQAVNATGTPSGASFRVTKHPENMQGVLDGAMFTGANVQATPVTTQAGLSATTPVLTLSNPAGSGVNLVLVRTTVDFAAAPAALCNLMLAYNVSPPTALTSANVTPNLIGSGTTPKGLCSAVATLAAAPVKLCGLGQGIAAATYTGVDGANVVFNGEYILPPGTSISIQTSSAASLLASFCWKEVAIGAA